MQMIKIAELPPLVKFTQAARLLGISRSTLAVWVRNGRVGKPIVFSPRNRQFETAKLLADVLAAHERGGLAA